eukprot:TRINITY_DN2164_c0_g1_i1.p2 TRINITY_DN2164_c0_g1~~TRINITY_DN2164_c0_g1_i1.p2  ORF type:complete len:268 (-),score=91.34 TRINITY_DN2164_c0_g1_i1:102-905(-)
MQSQQQQQPQASSGLSLFTGGLHKTRQQQQQQQLTPLATVLAQLFPHNLYQRAISVTPGVEALAGSSAVLRAAEESVDGGCFVPVRPEACHAEEKGAHHQLPLPPPGSDLHSLMKKYGPALFRQDCEGKYTCFFQGCDKRMSSNFSRHISLHERGGHVIKPEMMHLLGKQDLLFINCNDMFTKSPKGKGVKGGEVACEPSTRAAYSSKAADIRTALYHKLLQKADAKHERRGGSDSPGSWQEPSPKRRRTTPTTSPLDTPTQSPRHS